ncbi:MAG: hypothetical protein VB071_09535 [Lawsonibacter sp.]|nr:hypothetical protein [Lawsonibacter sp.]
MYGKYQEERWNCFVGDFAPFACMRRRRLKSGLGGNRRANQLQSGHSINIIIRKILNCDKDFFLTEQEYLPNLVKNTKGNVACLVGN